MRVIVRYGSEDAVSLDMNKGHSFDDFRNWVLFRFQIPSSDKLTFKLQDAENGLEIIPSFSQLRALKENKRVIIISNISRAENSKTSSEVPTGRSCSGWELKHWYPLLALALLCIVLGDRVHDREEVVQLLRRAMQWHHACWRAVTGVALPDKVVVDAVTTLLAYPVTTFFIRRVLNPDTGGVQASFQKYGSDVLFAALSSAVLTHIKHFLKLKILEEL